MIEDTAAAAGLAAEQHRNYLVARFDITDRLLRAGARLAPDGPVQVGWALAVRNELRLLQARAADAGLGRLDVLGEQRTVAAMLALQNPDHPPDRHGGLRWAQAFAAYTTATTHHAASRRAEPQGAVGSVAAVAAWLGDRRAASGRGRVRPPARR